MEAKFPNAKLASIEEELKVLRAQLSGKHKRGNKIKKFSQLEGLWRGKADFSFEEIKQVEIKLKESR